MQSNVGIYMETRRDQRVTTTTTISAMYIVYNDEQMQSILRCNTITVLSAMNYKFNITQHHNPYIIIVNHLLQQPHLNTS